MPKAVSLTPDALLTLQTPPLAATPPRTLPPRRNASERVKAPAPKLEQLPLQVRLPREQVRAIKVAAAEREQTISDFMLACFHAYMKAERHA
jgi:hypothetical protein